jgi:hypothetical protein
VHGGELAVLQLAVVLVLAAWQSDARQPAVAQLGALQLGAVKIGACQPAVVELDALELICAMVQEVGVHPVLVDSRAHLADAHLADTHPADRHLWKHPVLVHSTAHVVAHCERAQAALVVALLAAMLLAQSRVVVHLSHVCAHPGHAVQVDVVRAHLRAHTYVMHIEGGVVV